VRGLRRLIVSPTIHRVRVQFSPERNTTAIVTPHPNPLPCGEREFACASGISTERINNKSNHPPQSRQALTCRAMVQMRLSRSPSRAELWRLVLVNAAQQNPLWVRTMRVDEPGRGGRLGGGRRGGEGVQSGGCGRAGAYERENGSTRDAGCHDWLLRRGAEHGAKRPKGPIGPESGPERAIRQPVAQFVTAPSGLANGRRCL
jgi:hypothetical protein